MKVSDIKGDIGKRASYWGMDYINNLIFDEVKRVAPSLKFREGVQLWRMEDFKKLLSGKRVGFPTHGCASGETPWCSWVMHTLHSVYSKEPITVLLSKLESMFGEDIKALKNTIHKDIKGQELKVGDIICYSTTYSNKICLGTIDKFNDCSMVVDGYDVQYDSVLVVNNEIRYNEAVKHYEHR